MRAISTDSLKIYKFTCIVCGKVTKGVTYNQQSKKFCSRFCRGKYVKENQYGGK